MLQNTDCENCTNPKVPSNCKPCEECIYERDSNHCIPPKIVHCPPIWDEPFECKRMYGKEIYHKYSPAVLDISTATNLTTSTDPEAVYIPEIYSEEYPDALKFGVDFATAYTSGNGVFIKNHLILCPAELVLLPPNISKLWNQYPFECDKICDLFDGDSMLRVDRIYGTVHNLNGSDNSVVYQLRLLYVDGAANMAVLKIDECSDFNKCTPCVKKCHPYLKLNSLSNSYKVGDDVYVIGATSRRSSPVYYRRHDREHLPQNNSKSTYPGPLSNKNSRFFAEGVVSNNRYNDDSGLVLPELFVIDANVYSRCVGAAIIDKYGKLLALQTLSVTGGMPYHLDHVSRIGRNRNSVTPQTGDGMVAGISSRFMCPILTKMGKVLTSSKHTEHAEVVHSQYGDFYRHLHGYLGIATNVFSTEDFLSVYDQYGYLTPKYIEKYWDNGPSKHIVLGFIVRTLAGSLYPDNIILPGKSSNGIVYETFVDAVPGIEINDNIVFANKAPLGNGEGKVGLSLILWKTSPGDFISLGIRKISECYMNEVHEEKFQTQIMPKALDFPWSAYQNYDLNNIPTSGHNFYREFPANDSRYLVPGL